MSGIVDCDVHPAIVGLSTLIPYFDAYWKDHVTTRGLTNIDTSTYRDSLPITSRPDWRGKGNRAATNLEAVTRQLLEPFGVNHAICNVIHGGSSIMNPYFGAAICRATNDWLVEEWLSRDDRLLGSIVVPVQEPSLAAEEIARHASDPRFVQVLMPVAGEMPFGRRFFWPIYEEASKHKLPVAIHPGGGGRFPTSYIGYHSLYAEDYALQMHTLQYQISSLVHEGVFDKFSDLKVVILESGVSWLPAYLTDTDNKWMALRREVPWVKEAPSDIVKRHMRFSTQPFDVPDGSGGHVDRIIEMLGGDDIFLFSTDYPHWQFDGDDPYPPGLSTQRKEKLCWTNPMDTYPRLRSRLS